MMKSHSKRPARVLKGRAAGVLLEDIDSKIDLVVEKVMSLDAKVDKLDQRVDQLDKKIDGVEERLTQRANRLEEKVDGVQGEVVGIRVLLGRHDDILQKHEEEISALKRVSHH